MSLLSKLSVLVGLLVATAAVGIGASLWGVRALSRDIATPYERLTSALSHLNQTKRDVWELLTLMDGAGVPTLPPARREGTMSTSARDPRALVTTLTERAGELDAKRAFVSRVGLGTWRAIRERVQAGGDAVSAWLDQPGDDAARDRAAAALFELHELLERAEARTLDDSLLAADFGARMRRLVLVVMTASGAAALGVAAVALALIRRWIVRPVSELRAGADRIARGDFAYRVPVTGRDELALLGAEFNQMASTVAALQDERVARERLAAVGEMVQRIVHNLRNPLAGIRGLAEITRDDLPASSELREHQSRILATVDQFERWVRELLQSTTPAQVRRVRQPVRPVLEGVATALVPMGEARGVALRIDASGCPPQADIDRQHLEQAIIALVTNALEATPSGGRVDVGAAVQEREGVWELLVADDGPGVPDNLHQRIFEPQFTTKRGGTGIGLAMVAQVARGHAGSVRVENARMPRAPVPTGVSERSGGLFVMRLPLFGTREPGPEGRVGATGGQNSHHRGRGQPSVHHPQEPDQGGA